MNLAQLHHDWLVYSAMKQCDTYVTPEARSLLTRELRLAEEHELLLQAQALEAYNCEMLDL